MPKFMNMDDVEAQKTLSNFEFSGKRPDALQASEYTIASVVVDETGSVFDFKKDLEKALKSCIGACKKHPRSENILARVSAFNTDVREVHGFGEVNEIKEDDYDGEIKPDGGTALFDATLESLEATQQYNNGLYDMDYLCNAILFIVTDGDDNSSRIGTPEKVKKLIAKIRKEEKLESIKTVLIGVGEPDVQQYLDNFKDEANLDQFVWVGEATPAKLAKLADFISKSVSSTSQSLGSGGASQDITF